MHKPLRKKFAKKDKNILPIVISIVNFPTYLTKKMIVSYLNARMTNHRSIRQTRIKET